AGAAVESLLPSHPASDPMVPTKRKLIASVERAGERARPGISHFIMSPISGWIAKRQRPVPAGGDSRSAHQGPQAKLAVERVMKTHIGEITGPRVSPSGFHAWRARAPRQAKALMRTPAFSSTWRKRAAMAMAPGVSLCTQIDPIGALIMRPEIVSI